MARGGFLGRIGQAIRNIIAPPPRRPPPRIEEAPSPPPPSRDPFRVIWRREKEGRAGNYRKHRALFDKMMRDVREDDPDELQMLWESYIQNIVNSGGPRRRQDPRNMFWVDSGIDPRDFDWARWRAAMGFTGKRRSKS